MKKYLRKEVITPVVTLLFLLIYLLEAMKLSAPMVDGVPQESFFPVIIVVIGVLAALSLLASGIKVAARSEEAAKSGPKSIKPLLAVAAFAFLIFLFNTLGYVIVAPIFAFAMMMLFDDKPQNWKRKVVFSLLITVFVYVLYTYVFDINFPEIWR